MVSQLSAVWIAASLVLDAAALNNQSGDERSKCLEIVAAPQHHCPPIDAVVSLEILSAVAVLQVFAAADVLLVVHVVRVLKISGLQVLSEEHEA